MQGDFAAHIEMLRQCGVQACEVRSVEELERVDALVIPGGESTTMSRLCDRYGLWPVLHERIANGMGAFGTCAGLIMLSKNVRGAAQNFTQSTLGVLDIDVARNAYGKQLDSFETDLQIDDKPLRAVFIRAPRIERVGEDVNVLARHEGVAVVVRQGKNMGAAFHPEIAGDLRLHQLWLRTLDEDETSLDEDETSSASSTGQSTLASAINDREASI